MIIPYADELFQSTMSLLNEFALLIDIELPCKRQEMKSLIGWLLKNREKSMLGSRLFHSYWSTEQIWFSPSETLNFVLIQFFSTKGTEVELP